MAKREWTQEDEDRAVAVTKQAQEELLAIIKAATPEQVKGITLMLAFHDKWATPAGHRRLGKMYRSLATSLFNQDNAARQQDAGQ